MARFKGNAKRLRDGARSIAGHEGDPDMGLDQDFFVAGDTLQTTHP